MESSTEWRVLEQARPPPFPLPPPSTELTSPPQHLRLLEHDDLYDKSVRVSRIVASHTSATACSPKPHRLQKFRAARDDMSSPSLPSSFKPSPRASNCDLSLSSQMYNGSEARFRLSARNSAVARSHLNQILSKEEL